MLGSIYRWMGYKEKLAADRLLPKKQKELSKPFS